MNSNWRTQSHESHKVVSTFSDCLFQLANFLSFLLLLSEDACICPYSVTICCQEMLQSWLSAIADTYWFLISERRTVYWSDMSTN